MNSRWHCSESALAEVAAPFLSKPTASVLIGGLGIGFTLAAFVRKFGPTMKISVAEKSADVIRWYGEYFRNRFFEDVAESGVRLSHRDVREAMPETVDLIVLDVDNGPSAISTSENDWLYSRPGLEAFRRGLTPTGVLMLWSGFQSNAFAEDAEAIGFTCAEIAVPVGHADHHHYIYVCKNGAKE